MPEMHVEEQDRSQTGDILRVAAWTYRSTQEAHMVCSYLNHAAVYRQCSANHVDVGRGSGALPLRETTACGWVGRGVVEDMRGGISVGWAGGVNKDDIVKTGQLLFVFCATATKWQKPLLTFNRRMKSVTSLKYSGCGGSWSRGFLVSFLSCSFTIPIQASSVYVVPSSHCDCTNTVNVGHTLWISKKNDKKITE